MHAIFLILLTERFEERFLQLQSHKAFLVELALSSTEINILCDKDGHWELISKKITSTFANILLNNYSKVKSDVFKGKQSNDSNPKCPKKRKIDKLSSI